MTDKSVVFVVQIVIKRMEFISLLVVVVVVFPFRIFVTRIGSMIAAAQIAPKTMVKAKVFAKIGKLGGDALA